MKIPGLTKAFLVIPENGIVIFQTDDRMGLTAILEEYGIEFTKRGILALILDDDIEIQKLTDKDLDQVGLVRVLSRYDKDLKTH